MELSKEAKEELQNLQRELDLKFPEGIKDINCSAHVVFKSTPENWFKEKIGLKPNTFRKVDDNDYRFRMLREFPSIQIIMVNSITNEEFIRQITDYTEWDGYAIISWRHKENTDD